MLDLSSAAFWIAVMQIIAIDLILSGDNAVVIALACRNLPPEQRKKGIFWGVFGAVGLRVLLTAFAAKLLGMPYLKLAGGLLLLWIGVRLLVADDQGGHEIAAASGLWSAVKTIVIADFVMSVDNVIAVAAASRDSLFLLLFGLAVSIPLIVWSSQIVLKLMERYPVMVTFGAGLLGWVAGGMLVGDVAVKEQVEAMVPAAQYVAAVLGAAFVVAAGTWIARRRTTADYPVV